MHALPKGVPVRTFVATISSIISFSGSLTFLTAVIHKHKDFWQKDAYMCAKILADNHDFLHSVKARRNSIPWQFSHNDISYIVFCVGCTLCLYSHNLISSIVGIFWIDLSHHDHQKFSFGIWQANILELPRKLQINFVQELPYQSHIMQVIFYVPFNW